MYEPFALMSGVKALFAALTPSSAASISFFAESNDGRDASAVSNKLSKFTSYAFEFNLSFKITFCNSGIPTAFASCTEASSSVFFALIRFTLALPKLYSAVVTSIFAFLPIS